MNITVASFTTTDNYKASASAPILRVYFSETFVASDGVVVPGGAVGSAHFYRSVQCTLQSGVVTCPSFTLPSTTDSSRPYAKASFALYNGTTHVQTLFADLSIPTALGENVTVAQLVAYNAGVFRPLNDTFPTTAHVATMISEAVANEASSALAQSGYLRPVLELDGTQTIDLGKFYAQNVALPTTFYYELIVRPDPVEALAGKYYLSESAGGAHAMLLGHNSPHLQDGTHGIYANFFSPAIPASSIEAYSDTGVFPGEWGKIAVGCDGGTIYFYVDDVPVGIVGWPTPGRRSSASDGDGHLYVGGSDHQQIKARLAGLRIFEAGNPRAATGSLLSHVPLRFFDAAQHDDAAVAVGLWDFTQPGNLIADLSRAGYNGGHHPGRPRSMPFAHFRGAREAYPLSKWVYDPTAPTYSLLERTVFAAPAALPAPLPVPSGALIFDSFQRAKTTYFANGVGGLGSTEGGSRGPLAWQVTSTGTDAQLKDFAILNGVAYEAGGNAGSATVDAGSANLDIRVSRRYAGALGGQSGKHTSIVFRQADANNYWVALTTDSLLDDTSPWTVPRLTLAKVVAGVGTVLLDEVAMPSTTWVTLRVVTKADGTYAVYAIEPNGAINAVVGASGTDAALASNTRCGIATSGYVVRAGLACRWDNFTVLPAA